jgi:hypothetical protein
VDNVIITEKHSPLYAAFQLSHIAGPMMAHKHIDSSGGNPVSTTFPVTPSPI